MFAVSLPRYPVLAGRSWRPRLRQEFCAEELRRRLKVERERFIERAVGKRSRA